LFLFSYDDLPRVVITLISICGAGSLCLTFVGAAASPATLLALGLWCCASLVLAIFLGHSLHSDTLGSYHQLQHGYNFSGIDPSLSLPQEYANFEAAVVSFVADTFVDDLRTIGFFSDGSTYCVAPVARHGVPEDNVVFWAVGIDCCEARTNFDCGTSRTLGSTTAMVYASDSDPLFRRAIEVSGSIYGTTNSSEGPHLVRFVNDPDEVEAFWLREAIITTVLALLLHLLWTFFLVLGVDRLASAAAAARQAQSNGAPGGAPLTFPAQPEQESKRLVFDASNDPFLRGGGSRRAPNGHVPPSPHSLAQDTVSSSTTAMDKSEAEFFDENKQNPNFFSNVSIAKDGGFSEVEGFYSKQTWGDFVSAAITPCFIMYNMFFILSTDIEFLFSPKPTLDKMYLISTSVLVEPIANFFARASGNKDADLNIGAQQAFAILEISGMMYYVISLLYRCLALSWQPDWQKWRTVYEIYWEEMPMLSTYSLMSFLEPICPTVLIASFEEEVASAARDSVISAREWGMLVKFFLRRIIYAIIGFDAFLTKFRMAARHVCAGDVSMWAVLGAANFVMQLVGVVKMGNFVQRRLFIFMFAGEDCIMSPQDEVSMRTYNSLLARKIYLSSKSWLHFSVIMLNFSDYDFQKLVLNEGTRSHAPSDSDQPAAFRWPWRAQGSSGTAAAAAAKSGGGGRSHREACTGDAAA